MENDLQVKYDSLCYSTFLNVRHLTNGVNYIYLKNFECDNKEHQFVAAVVNACYSILGEKELNTPLDNISSPFEEYLETKILCCFLLSTIVTLFF